jgi:hypothetical protein
MLCLDWSLYRIAGEHEDEEHEDEEQEGTATCSGFSKCPWVSVVSADLGVWVFSVGQ